MLTNSQGTPKLIILTVEILNGKLHILCSVRKGGGRKGASLRVQSCLFEQLALQVGSLFVHYSCKIKSFAIPDFIKYLPFILLLSFLSLL